MDTVRAEGDGPFIILKERQLEISSVCQTKMPPKAMNYVDQQCVFSAHIDPDTKRSMTIMGEN
jgi:hypothetical protein